MTSKIKRKNNRLKYYYDACALEGGRIENEILDKKNPKVAIVSHLSLGEAYSNALKKRKEDDFLKLMKKVKDHIKIVGNDSIEKALVDAKNFFRLSITDAIHLATAIKYKCNVLRTSDKDLYKIPKRKIDRFAKKYSNNNFSISKI